MTHIGDHAWRLGLAAEHFEKGFAITLQLARTDAADLGHLGHRSGFAAQHFQQGRVRENNVRRYAVLFGQLAAQRAQGFPLLALFATYQLTGRAAGAASRRGLWLEVLAQFQRNFATQQRAARLAEAQAAIAFKVNVRQTTRNQLAEQRAPLGLGARLADPEHRKVLMAEAFYLVVGLAEQHVDQMTDAITLAGTVDGRQRLTRRFGGIPGLHAIDAVVAMAARVGHVFVEIGQQGLPTATGFFAQGEHGIELVLLQPLVALVTFGVLQHLLEHQHVLQTVGHPGIGGQTVTPCPTGFLIISLERFGQVHVRDEPHVGLVDAHAERDGRDHDQPFLVEKALLIGRPGFGGQAGVIRQRRIAVVTEKDSDLIDLLARQAVDDTGVAAALGKESQQLFARLFLGHDAIKDVGPVEAGQKALCVLQVQTRDDFFTGALVGSGGQRDARHVRKQLGQLPQLQVFRAEVMTPLRHAVRFVDGKQGDLEVLQE